MRSVHTLVPDRLTLDGLGELPEGVTASCWDGNGEPPEQVRRTTFWVPPFLLPPAGLGAFPAMPDLRVVQLMTAGADTFVGRLPAGVTLCDARGVHSAPTAEWAVAAVLCALHCFPRFVLAQAERRWDRVITDELAGKRVLIVGAGDIGEHIARRLDPFDVTVTRVARRARPGVHGAEELPDLLPDADVVILVVPLTAATRGMVDAGFLACMRDGALLVNAARGPVVDTGALLAELSAGRLRAALDVTDPEPLPADHPLWTAPGLLVTPHVGGAVPGFPRRAQDLVRAQLARHAAGAPLHNVVVDGY
ncbi:MAG TPA: 2-hydroxyacid dehydrogenase [Mycobacteriales bacterium]|nr:2-hydroxyacid dehydrogenase [Mycobacteriales bacterium]